MGLLRLLGKLTGTEGKVKWSQSKKIEVVGPDFFGQYFIYVDPDFNVAIFLPKADRTLHIFVGDIFRAHRWIKCDQGGEKIKDRGTGFPPGKPGYRGKVISSEDFFDEINEEWINSKIKEYVHMLST